ncbi:DNA recombination protein RmuC [Pseudactinotalea sp. HY158]|nr:DNA recombination protein RmuC [Pseudactinotalea sp. HY158]
MTMDAMHVIMLLIGVTLGAALGWLLARARGGGRAARLTAENTALLDRLGAADRHHEARLAELSYQYEQRLDDARRQAAIQVADERARAAARLDELRDDQHRLSSEFAALSAKALASNSESFLAQAEERFKRAGQASEAELAKREQAVQALVEPLSKALGEVKSEMTTAERARSQAHGALAEQVKAMQASSEKLRAETSDLVTALRAPQVRGRWGEMQLRRVVEAAGMLNHVDFSEQPTYAADASHDGAVRPDLVVHLPGEKQVVIDSKVAFSGFLEAMEASDEGVRTKRLAAHARHMRTHIDSLAGKAYWERLEVTPEFVVMFVPAETFLNAALDTDPALLEYAFENNVVMATPATLVALLRTIAFTWRQDRLAADAQQIFTVGRELHKRLGVMGSHLRDLGNRLNSSVEAFNRLNSSIDSRLVPQLRRFSELQGLEPNLDVPDQLGVLAVTAYKEDVHTP